MKLIDILGLKNFRIFDDINGFKEDLSSINLFTGANNSGKSTVIKSLQLLKNSVKEEQSIFDLDLSLQEHLLGDFDNVLHNKENKSVEISIPFTFLGLPDLHISLGFHIPKVSDNYRAKLRTIKVIDNLDDAILFSFKYRKVTVAENNTDVEAFEKKQQNDEAEAIHNGFNHPYPNFYDPLQGFVEWQINLGKLKSKLNELEEFYVFYLENRSQYRWLEQIDELAEKENMAFVPSMLVKSFRGDVDIAEWTGFTNSLSDEIISGNADVRDSNFETDDFAPPPTIEELLYYKSLDIIRAKLGWESTDQKKNTEYNVMENCFRSAWKSLIQRILTVNYLSTVKEQNSRIYSSASNSSFVTLLKEYHSFNLRNSPFLIKYLEKFQIGKKINVIYQHKYQLISISITTFEDVERDLVDFGYGIKQLILVLIQISVLAERNKVTREEYDEQHGQVYVNYYNPSLLIVEEPEANLHPKWQSLLSELISEANKQFKIQFVIETHSEYLIRKFQTLVADNMIDGNKIKIFYLRNLQNVANNVQQMSSMNIASDGSIDYKVFDSGFFDEADKLELSLLNFQRNSFIDDFEALKIEQGENESKIVGLETKIDEFTAKFDTQVYEREAALLFDVSKLETKTVEYLVSGLLLFALSEDGNDFSPVMLQFGRAVEYELKQMFVNILAERYQTIGGMQQHFVRYVNYQGEYTAGDNTTTLEIELNNRFRNPRNLRVDLLEDLRVGRNNAAHSGSSHDRQDALSYIDVVKEFLGNLTSEKI